MDNMHPCEEPQDAAQSVTTLLLIDGVVESCTTFLMAYRSELIKVIAGAPQGHD